MDLNLVSVSVNSVAQCPGNQVWGHSENMHHIFEFPLPSYIAGIFCSTKIKYIEFVKIKLNGRKKIGKKEEKTF